MKLPSYSIAVAGFLMIVWMSWSCKDEISGPSGDIMFPDSGVSYVKQVEPLFMRSCGSSQCHTGEDPAAGLSLETYQRALEKAGVIVPFHPEASLLVAKIEGRAPGARMPLFREPLSNNQIKGIRRWISEGAQNN